MSDLFNHVANISRPPLFPRNPEVSRWLQADYQLDELEALRSFLASKGTLDLFRYKDTRQNGVAGGAPAVTPILTRGSELAELSVASGAGEALGCFCWDRDSMLMECAEMAVRDDPSLAAGTIIDPEQWKSGLLFSLAHHVRDEKTILEILLGITQNDNMKCPHVRVNAVTGVKSEQPWGNDQWDALADVNFILFRGLLTNGVRLEDEAFGDVANKFACLMHSYFHKIDIANARDVGSWEAERRVHWSSVASLAVSLSQQLKFLRRSERRLFYEAFFERDTTAGGKERIPLSCDVSGVEELLTRCRSTLARLGTAEFLAEEDGKQEARLVDAAQLNPILLMALADDPIVEMDVILAIIANVERDLIRAIGGIRFFFDDWDGRVHRSAEGIEGKEAQWCHISPMLSVIYGWLYERTGDGRFKQLQVYHFNRGLAALSRFFLPAESWVFDEKSGSWTPNANHPLAWPQAMILLSFAWMKKSIRLKQGQVNT